MKVRPNARVIAALRSFAGGRITTDGLRSRLLVGLGLRKSARTRKALPWFGVRSVCPPRAVRVTRRHLERALTRTREKGITERELANWATMSLVNDVFYWAGKDADLIGEWISGLSLDLVQGGCDV